MREWVNSEGSDPAQLQPWSLSVATHPLLLPCLNSLRSECGVILIHRLSASVRSALDSYACSGKFIALKLLLEKTLCIGDYSETHEDDPAKIVLFSQHPAALDLVCSQLLQRYSTLQYVSLTSSQSPKQRMDAVDAFQQNPSIRLLLATTGVCGHGLTLTAARVVILLDHNYNPYVDMQAIDRCHRIGQHSMVRVVRLISDEANESRMMCLQRFKEHVASTVIKTDAAKEVDSSIQQEIAGPMRGVKRERPKESEDLDEMMFEDKDSSGFTIFE